MSYSLYLMQNHNTEEYNKFLRILYKLKCHWICCACFNVEAMETETALDEAIEKEMEKQDSPKYSPEDTINETGDQTVKYEHSNMPQHSINTKIDQSMI